jgi:hypothetical protein
MAQGRGSANSTGGTDRIGGLMKKLIIVIMFAVSLVFSACGDTCPEPTTPDAGVVYPDGLWPKFD